MIRTTVPELPMSMESRQGCDSCRQKGGKLLYHPGTETWYCEGCWASLGWVR